MLTSLIQGFNDLKKKGKFDRLDFEYFCMTWNIPNQYVDSIFPCKNPSEKALEIMCEQGLIKEPKSFREFQSHLSQLSKKYSGAVVAPVIATVLDLPSQQIHLRNPQLGICALLESLKPSLP
jgi:hypothetical protein